MSALETSGEFAKEMRRWAKTHGSRRLQMGMEDGYRMVGVYLSERLAIEAPGFYAWLPDEHVTWKDRTGPTEEALLLRRDVLTRKPCPVPDEDIEIVWFKQLPSGMYDSEMHEGDNGCEAIVIPEYLNRYTLIGVVSSDEAPVSPDVLEEFILNGEAA